LRSGGKDGLPNDRAVAVDGAGKKPDVQSARPLGPTVRMDHQRAAPARKISYKTSHRASPVGTAIAPIIGSPNPIASGFEEPGEVSSDSNERDQLRIYIQTDDPNIRIIWIVPKSDDGD
jgi:hypothetical protein